MEPSNTNILYVCPNCSNYRVVEHDPERFQEFVEIFDTELSDVGPMLLVCCRQCVPTDPDEMPPIEEISIDQLHDLVAEIPKTVLIPDSWRDQLWDANLYFDMLDTEDDSVKIKQLLVFPMLCVLEFGSLNDGLIVRPDGSIVSLNNDGFFRFDEYQRLITERRELEECSTIITELASSDEDLTTVAAMALCILKGDVGNRFIGSKWI
jgi:hypothetical protein